MKSNDFASQLATANTPEKHAFWENAYRQVFPNVLRVEFYDADMDAQNNGVDAAVFRQGAPPIRIENKERQKWYGDILLEYVHEYEDGHIRPGWIERPLRCDYLAYAILTTGHVWFLPWLPLRLAWERHKLRWLNSGGRYNPTPAQNSGYVTKNVAVPPDELWGCINGVLQIDP